MNLQHRPASAADADLLAGLNHQLIRDEGHRNPMTVPELAARMSGWLSGEYAAAIFEREQDVMAYALWRREGEAIYLRQFFVGREHRRQGVGRAAIELLFAQILPPRTRVVLEVLLHNESGRRFWQAVGFRDYAVTVERSVEK